MRGAEPRVRARILAGVGLGLPIACYALVELANLAGLPRLAGALLPLLLVGFIVGAALSLAAVASGFAALLRAEAPRPAWRYLEPWVLPLPFMTLAAVFVSGFAARLY